MYACRAIIKNNKQHAGWKHGNFGGKLKLYGTFKQEEKTYGRETEPDKEKRRFSGSKR